MDFIDNDILLSSCLDKQDQTNLNASFYSLV